MLLKGVKKIEKDVYKMFISQDFGVELVDSIHLCNIREKQDDGFYKIEGQLNVLLDNK